MLNGIIQIGWPQRSERVFCIVLKEIKLREWIATQNTILNPEPKGYQKVKRKIVLVITGSFKSWKHGIYYNLILPYFKCF